MAIRRKTIRSCVLALIALSVLSVFLLFQVGNPYETIKKVNVILRRNRPPAASVFFDTRDLPWAQAMRAHAHEIYAEVRTRSFEDHYFVFVLCLPLRAAHGDAFLTWLRQDRRFLSIVPPPSPMGSFWRLNRKRRYPALVN